jgi:hypothetical protein
MPKSRTGLLEHEWFYLAAGASAESCRLCGGGKGGCLAASSAVGTGALPCRQEAKAKSKSDAKIMKR